MMENYEIEPYVKQINKGYSPEQLVECILNNVSKLNLLNSEFMFWVLKIYEIQLNASQLITNSSGEWHTHIMKMSTNNLFPLTLCSPQSFYFDRKFEEFSPENPSFSFFKYEEDEKNIQSKKVVYKNVVSHILADLKEHKDPSKLPESDYNKLLKSLGDMDIFNFFLIIQSLLTSPALTTHVIMTIEKLLDDSHQNSLKVMLLYYCDAKKDTFLYKHLCNRSCEEAKLEKEEMRKWLPIDATPHNEVARMLYFDIDRILCMAKKIHELVLLLPGLTCSNALTSTDASLVCDLIDELKLIFQEHYISLHFALKDLMTSYKNFSDDWTYHSWRSIPHIRVPAKTDLLTKFQFTSESISPSMTLQAIIDKLLFPAVMPTISPHFASKLLLYYKLNAKAEPIINDSDFTPTSILHPTLQDYAAIASMPPISESIAPHIEKVFEGLKQQIDDSILERLPKQTLSHGLACGLKSPTVLTQIQEYYNLPDSLDSQEKIIEHLNDNIKATYLKRLGSLKLFLSNLGAEPQQTFLCITSILARCTPPFTHRNFNGYPKIYYPHASIAANFYLEQFSKEKTPSYPNTADNLRSLENFLILSQNNSLAHLVVNLLMKPRVRKRAIRASTELAWVFDPCPKTKIGHFTGQYFFYNVVNKLLSTTKILHAGKPDKVGILQQTCQYAVEILADTNLFRDTLRAGLNYYHYLNLKLVEMEGLLGHACSTMPFVRNSIYYRFYRSCTYYSMLLNSIIAQILTASRKPLNEYQLTVVELMVNWGEHCHTSSTLSEEREFITLGTASFNKTPSSFSLSECDTTSCSSRDTSVPQDFFSCPNFTLRDATTIYPRSP